MRGATGSGTLGATLGALLALLTLALAGCGYRLAGTAALGTGTGTETGTGDAADSAATLAIPVLENDSTEPGLELVVTDAILREFLRRGRFRVVDEVDQADWVLRGSVLPVRVVGQSFSSVILALEYTVEMQLQVSLEPRGGEALRFDSAILRESEIYLASADLEAMRKNRQEALRRVARVLAARIHASLLVGGAP